MHSYYNLPHRSIQVYRFPVNQFIFFPTNDSWKFNVYYLALNGKDWSLKQFVWGFGAFYDI